MREVARRVSDGSILSLLKGWLRAPIVEESKEGKRKVTPNRQGTPQGGVISPLLANIYLNPLDHRINGSKRQRHRMVRYADDFVVLSPPGRSAEARQEIERWLESRGLAFNASKTRTVTNSGRHSLSGVRGQSAPQPQRATVCACGSHGRKLPGPSGEGEGHPQSSHAMASHCRGGRGSERRGARLEWLLPLR